MGMPSDFNLPKHRQGKRHYLFDIIKNFIPYFGKKLVSIGFKTILILCCAILIGQFTYNRLCKSEFFQIATISVQGCHLTSKDLIQELSGVTIHSNLLALDSTRIKDKIETNAWIDRVRIHKKWPSNLLIEVKEKEPFALINKPKGLFYIDKFGQTLVPVMPSGEIDYPVITGQVLPIAQSKNGDGQNSILLDALELLHIAKSTNPILPRQNISEINIAENGELTLYLLDQVFPIYLGRDNMKEKYYRLVKVLKGLYKKQEISNTAYIQVDYQKNEILVGMGKS